ncbi:MAG: bidirectional hydrogenase complex protein HoxU [Cyanobacteria bacterium J149]|nr:MAG: bidirectional hydrogenase complex protein HoxU [Cyanobacteria bacterium J149]
MAVVTLKIDDIDVAIASGSSVLSAAKEEGVKIPTLCHLEGVSDVGACRLCLVQIKGSDKLVPSCITEVTEGMEVFTQTDILKEYRKMTVELLFAEGNHICATCVANNNCQLQDTAVEVGMDHSRFNYRFPDRDVDLSHPMFGIDHNRCILCTRCVRVCSEIEGAHVWNVGFRGAAAKIISGLNQPWGDVSACTSCGKCVEACPTGTIFRKGATTAEMHKHPDNIEFLNTAREKHQWTR